LAVGKGRGTIKGTLSEALAVRKKSPRLNIALGGTDPNAGLGVNIPG
jgi:hypothetical protein